MDVKVRIRAPNGAELTGRLTTVHAAAAEGRLPVLVVDGDLLAYVPESSTPWGPAETLELVPAGSESEPAAVLIESWRAGARGLRNRMSEPARCGHVGRYGVACERGPAHDGLHIAEVRRERDPRGGTRQLAWNDAGDPPSRPGVGVVEVVHRPPPCGEPHPERGGARCQRPRGHDGRHRWTDRANLRDGVDLRWGDVDSDAGCPAVSADGRRCERSPGHAPPHLARPDDPEHQAVATWSDTPHGAPA